MGVCGQESRSLSLVRCLMFDFKRASNCCVPLACMMWKKLVATKNLERGCLLSYSRGWPILFEVESLGGHSRKLSAVNAKEGKARPRPSFLVTSKPFKLLLISTPKLVEHPATCHLLLLESSFCRFTISSFIPPRRPRQLPGAGTTFVVLK